MLHFISHKECLPQFHHIDKQLMYSRVLMRYFFIYLRITYLVLTQ